MQWRQNGFTHLCTLLSKLAFHTVSLQQLFYSPQISDTLLTILLPLWIELKENPCQSLGPFLPMLETCILFRHILFLCVGLCIHLCQIFFCVKIGSIVLLCLQMCFGTISRLFFFWPPPCSMPRLGFCFLLVDITIPAVEVTVKEHLVFLISLRFGGILLPAYALASEFSAKLQKRRR